jgi:hypothetical protein
LTEAPNQGYIEIDEPEPVKTPIKASEKENSYSGKKKREKCGNLSASSESSGWSMPSPVRDLTPVKEKKRLAHIDAEDSYLNQGVS